MTEHYVWTNLFSVFGKNDNAMYEYFTFLTDYNQFRTKECVSNVRINNETNCTKEDRTYFKIRQSAVFCY